MSRGERGPTADSYCLSEYVLIRVRYVQKAVLVLVLLVDCVQVRRGRRDGPIHEQEDGLLCGQLQALADHVHELPARQVRRDKVLLLVDILEGLKYVHG
jgi:hypothetical protein